MSTDFTLIRSRRQTLAIEVTREAKVVVRAPLRCPRHQIDTFVESRKDWIESALARQKTHLAARPPLSEAETGTLRQWAKAYIPSRVAHWAQRMGLQPAAVKITSARTRFGSCSGKNSLCFSWRLMLYPPEAIDYVVVHELAHIRHHNHSRDFWAFVVSVMPDYRARQMLLHPDLD